MNRPLQHAWTKGHPRVTHGPGRGALGGPWQPCPIQGSSMAQPGAAMAKPGILAGSALLLEWPGLWTSPVSVCRSGWLTCTTHPACDKCARLLPRRTGGRARITYRYHPFDQGLGWSAPQSQPVGHSVNAAMHGAPAPTGAPRRCRHDQHVDPHHLKRVYREVKNAMSLACCYKRRAARQQCPDCVHGVVWVIPRVWGGGRC